MNEAAYQAILKRLGVDQDASPVRGDKNLAALAERAPGKVQMVDLKPGRLVLGTWVEFESPLFGLCTGQVAGILSGDDLIVAHHSVLQELTPIKAAWVVRVLPNDLAHLTEATG